MKSKVVRIDGTVAKRIEEVMQKYGINSAEASRIIFTGRLPNSRGRKKKMSVKELFNRDLNNYDIRLIYNPKK